MASAHVVSLTSGDTAGIVIGLGIPALICVAIAVIEWAYFRLQAHRADAVAMASYRKLAEEAVANQQELRAELTKLTGGRGGREADAGRGMSSATEPTKGRPPDDSRMRLRANPLRLLFSATTWRAVGCLFSQLLVSGFSLQRLGDHQPQAGCFLAGLAVRGCGRACEPGLGASVGGLQGRSASGAGPCPRSRPHPPSV
jgi:hypothetical protein